jgi:peptidase E
VLFLPTGAKDAPEYADEVEAEMKAVGAGGFETLFLTRNPSPKAVDQAFAAADLVYFGGGGSPLILKHGDRYALRDRLRVARDRGAVLAGVSGGAIALFDGGAGAYNGYRPLPGWGLAPGGILPHFHVGEEDGVAPWFAGDPSKVLYGVEDCAALVWDGTAPRAVGAVWRLTWDGVSVRRVAVG